MPQTSGNAQCSLTEGFIPSSNTAEKLTEFLREKILSGDPAPGEKLPPERHLAEALGVSRITVRTALTRLENERLVYTRQGSGSVVLDFRLTGGVDLLEKMPKSVQDLFLPSLLELRRAVAVEAIRLACRRAKRTHIVHLRKIAVQISKREDPVEIMELDIEFSRAVFQAARNPVMALLLNTVENLYRKRTDLIEAFFHERQDVSGSYEILVDLIDGDDPETAASFVRLGLETRDEITLKRLKAR